MRGRTRNFCSGKSFPSWIHVAKSEKIKHRYCDSLFDAGFLKLHETTEKRRIKISIVSDQRAIILLHIGVSINALDNFSLSAPTIVNNCREREVILRPQFVQILSLGIWIPWTCTDKMDLEPNGVDRGFVKFIMDECWDMRPASLDAYFLEVLVEGDARIALNTHKCPVLASIEYDRLDYATVCDDRLLQLFEGSAFRTARLVIVPSTQCQEYLVWRRILSIHLRNLRMRGFDRSSSMSSTTTDWCLPALTKSPPLGAAASAEAPSQVIAITSSRCGICSGFHAMPGSARWGVSGSGFQPMAVGSRNRPKLSAKEIWLVQ